MRKRAESPMQLIAQGNAMGVNARRHCALKGQKPLILGNYFFGGGDVWSEAMLLLFQSAYGSFCFSPRALPWAMGLLGLRPAPAIVSRIIKNVCGGAARHRMRKVGGKHLQLAFASHLILVAPAGR